MDGAPELLWLMEERQKTEADPYGMTTRKDNGNRRSIRLRSGQALRDDNKRGKDNGNGKSNSKGKSKSKIRGFFAPLRMTSQRKGKGNSNSKGKCGGLSTAPLTMRL
jgi:hypothetical protein